MAGSRQENAHRSLGAVLFGGAVIWIGAEAALVADADIADDFFHAWLLASYLLLGLGIWAAVLIKRDMLVMIGALAASLGALGVAFSTAGMMVTDGEGIRAIEGSTLYMIAQIAAVAGVALIGVSLLMGQRRGMMMPLGAIVVAAAAFAAATHVFDLDSPMQPVSLIILGVALLLFSVAAASPDRWIARPALSSP